MSISTRPLAVGLVGLGRMGLYHLERLSLRSDMYPVAVLDADPQDEDDKGRILLSEISDIRSFVTFCDLLALFERGTFLGIF